MNAPSLAPRANSRRAVARSRAISARAALAECRFCSHDCGVNRLAGAFGRCHAGAESRCFSAQLETGDELELIPTFAMAFSGCDLRCDFCITGAESWNSHSGELVVPESLARKAQRALTNGARTVMFLGGEPTIHLPAALEIAAAMPAEAKLVWKTNVHCSHQAREFLDGIFDVWLADYKFGNDACAKRLANADDYTRIVRQNLLWADTRSELIVRHLLMPGHLDCCWRPVAEWVASELPYAKVSLRAGFWPAWRAIRHPELRQPNQPEEARHAFELAAALGLNLIP
jgi:putative pyruvate formate lyase activating enzyme